MLHPTPPNPGVSGRLNGIAFASLLLMPLAFSRRARRAIRKRSLPTLALALIALLSTGAFIGCSQSNAAPAATTTSPGSYSVSVTVAGAPSATTVTLPLTVQ
jgi:hypothetical protein